MKNSAYKLVMITAALLVGCIYCNDALAQNFDPSPVSSADVQQQNMADDSTKVTATINPMVNSGKDMGINSELKKEVTIDQMPLEDSKYTLGINDVIEVTVSRHPELSKQYVINNEGNIQYEFIGDIQISGLTKKEAKELITDRLSTYVVSPEVSIKITGYNSKIVYVIGEVASPGKIFMRGDTITVREVLLQAGLPVVSASMRKCRLITSAGGGQAKEKIVNVYALMYEGDLRENLEMKPGETLYIPSTVMAKVLRVILPVTQPITATAAAAVPVAGL